MMYGRYWRTAARLGGFHPHGSDIIVASNGLLNNLISYWKLDEASGTRNDSHGANHLTDNNTVTQAAGKIGDAGQFTRANSEYLSIADNADLSTGDINFTIACWVYIDSFPGIMSIVCKGGNTLGAREWFLAIDSPSNLIDFALSSDGSNSVAVAESTSAPSSEAWHFIVGWHDSVADTTNLQIDNGTVVSTATAGAVPSDRAGSFTIGEELSLSRFFNGRIDEVGFWKRALSAAERTTLWAGGAGLPYSAFTT